MARKNLLAGLTGSQLTAVNPEPAEPHKSSSGPHLGIIPPRGAIGAVTRSIEQLKAQAIIDIEPHLIEASFVADRLESSEEHHRALVESIREHGQQVPVLVRPHPEKHGRYQI